MHENNSFEDMETKINQVLDEQSNDLLELATMLGLNPLTDFREADLSRTNLMQAQLSGADLSGTNLNNTNLCSANLRSASLRRANLTDANLTDADLTGADLTGADLTGADLTGADLAGANLTRTKLTGVDLSQIDWTTTLGTIQRQGNLDRTLENIRNSISVLLVDDHADFRQGLRTLLSFYTDGPAKFEVVAEATSIDQAIEMVEIHNPRITLLDMELDQGTGLDFLQRLRSMKADTRVLSLSAHREDEWVFQAMQAGARGYVAKDKLATQLYDAIQTVLHDEIYLDPELASAFFRLFHASSDRHLQACEEIRLTEREQEVLHWLVQGASNEVISKQLFITVATVKAHLTAIFDKLKVRSRTQAIVKAIKLGLVQT